MNFYQILNNMENLRSISYALSFSILFICCSTNEEDTSTGTNNCATICEYNLDTSETAANLPNSLDGTYSLAFSKDSQSTNTFYADGVMGEFTIKNNQLTITVNGECVTLINPIQTSAAESSFVNSCGTNFVYSVSMQSNGTLNEINVLSRSGRFLGQFN